MVLYRLPFLLILSVCAPSIAWAQPVSHSMAQCSALYYATSTWSDEADTKTHLEQQSELWFAAALDFATQDALSAPFETLTNIANETEGRWLSKGPTAIFGGDYKDWSTYCVALANAEMLEINPL